ncbi:MAG: hypothetical protein K2Q45_03100 [Nitrosomonas sp.]|nr:hypothetical protein [Nitrosomonas sp.]
MSKDWYKIRAKLFGEPGCSQNVKKALEWASKSTHPEAVWLTKVCAGKNIETEEEAKAVFVALGENDARAMCFAAMVNDECELHWYWLKKSAEMGYALAQANAYILDNFEKHFAYSVKSSLQGEREGFYQVAFCYERGKGCAVNLNKAKENYFIAAKMNYPLAMADYAMFLNPETREFWYWLGRAAKKGFVHEYLKKFDSIVHKFKNNDDQMLAPAVFMIGRFFYGQMKRNYSLKRSIFNREQYVMDIHFEPMIFTCHFFVNQCAAARKAIDAWCLLALRFNRQINRDIRKKIGMLVWLAREDADYNVEIQKDTLHKKLKQNSRSK